MCCNPAKGKVDFVDGLSAPRLCEWIYWPVQSPMEEEIPSVGMG